MDLRAQSLSHLDQEARALLARLRRIRAYSLLMPMVPAASVRADALAAIERFLSLKKRELALAATAYRRELRTLPRGAFSPAEAQRAFSLLKIRFNNILSQFDIFADVLNQRSEHDTGVWLAGLDAVARDALELPGRYEAPPLMCYLDRGHGAAIRRARTRLPGGWENPVAVIRVPRERMIGTGIASSLIHEVGHQGSVLLGLAGSLRPLLRGLRKNDRDAVSAWALYERWISEILADFWAIARIGIASTQGLIGVVSLPRAFVFRFSPEDPHPFPWIRVKLSCAIGNALYPDPQWQRLAALWEELYPPADLPPDMAELISLLKKTMPGFVSLLVNHRPRSLRGRTLAEAIGSFDRAPARLRSRFTAWRGARSSMFAAPPSMVFAVLGQARADGRLAPERESRILEDMLRHWALKYPVSNSSCVTLPKVGVGTLFARAIQI